MFTTYTSIYKIHCQVFQWDFLDFAGKRLAFVRRDLLPWPWNYERRVSWKIFQPNGQRHFLSGGEAETLEQAQEAIHKVLDMYRLQADVVSPSGFEIPFENGHITITRLYERVLDLLMEGWDARIEKGGKEIAWIKKPTYDEALAWSKEEA